MTDDPTMPSGQKNRAPKGVGIWSVSVRQAPSPELWPSGILYLGEYRRNLIDAELKSLGVQAEMFAAALGEGAVTAFSPSGQQLVSEISNQIVRRLVETTGTRARLFSKNGSLIADSRRLMGPGGLVRIEALPPPGAEGGPF